MSTTNDHGRRGEQEAARRVEVGSRVRVRDAGAEDEDEYVIVSRTKADVAHGRISTESPVGRSLLGRACGEEVDVQTPGGLRRLTIVDVSPPSVSAEERST